MQSRYPHKWSSAFPDERTQKLGMIEWGDALGGLTGEEVKHGFATWKEEWPPSMWEFFTACRPPVKPASHREYTPLPAPVANHGPASVSHYAREIVETLKAIDMLPIDGETQHDYCMRCKVRSLPSLQELAK